MLEIMLNNCFASTVKAVPKPLRHTAKTWIIPPVLRAFRRARGMAISHLKTQRFSLPGHETFVGYYDISPNSPDGRALLAHAGKPKRRALQSGGQVRIGYFDSAGSRFVDVAQTLRWCWQLRARLRWRHNGETIIVDSTHEGFKAIYLIDASPYI